MRKVHISVDATVLVPVKCKLDVLINADDDANIEKAIKAIAANRRYSKADLVDIDLTDVGDDFSFVAFATHIRDVLDARNSDFNIESFKVTDSR